MCTSSGSFCFFRNVRRMASVKTIKGEQVLSYEEIERMRKGKSPLRIIAQKGCQERFLATNADITIFGGNRGGGKSYALLMEALKDIRDRNASMVVLRNEKPDLSGLIEKSYKLFLPFGRYNKSINDMTWNFDNGGKLVFSYFADSLADFKMRFQGKEFCYVGIDEITHISYEKFKYLITCNRNAYGLRNRFYGTCNPDPDSWVRRYIDWWIGEDGLPIPEKDGVLRYCFMDGDDINDVYWGDTPEEVYMQCREVIDSLWKEEYASLGFDKITMFVKSVTFIRGKLEENIALITSDPNYVANLAQQGFSGRKHGASMMLFHKLTMEQHRGSCRVIENFFRISPSRSPARTARVTPGTY